MTIPEIFVCYETTDTAFAQKLISDLEDTGAKVTADKTGLDDTAFEQFLAQELPHCQHLIVVQTPEALQSPRVRAVMDSALKQLQAGQMAGVSRVIAPAPNGTETQAVPLKWATISEFDASQDYLRALARLCLHLGVGPNVARDVLPPAPATPFLGLPDANGTNTMSPVAAPSYTQKPAVEDRPRHALRYPHLQLRRRLFFLSLAIALILIVTSVTAFILLNSAPTATGSTSVSSPTATPGTPVATSTSTASANLDDQVSQWALLSDQPGVTLTNPQAPKTVTTPSVDGNALQTSFKGQGVLVYRELPPVDNAMTFELNLSYYLSSVTPSTALAFTEGKLVNSQWWEWALQWQNGSNGGSWRIWDGNVWQNTQVMQTLAANTWHTLQIKGDIVKGQVHYISFSSDNALHNLGQTFAPGARPSGDHLAIFLELDGAQESPYQVYIDKFNLQWS